MSREIDISRDELTHTLMNLIEKGWASEVQGKKGIRWTITVEGRRIINSAN